MTHRIDIERKVINRFVDKAKRDRFLAFIQNEKTRAKFISELHHMNFLLQDLFDKVESNDFQFIKERIKVLGNIKDCYVISENRSIDGKLLDIETALKEVIGADLGSLIVFGDSEILYSEAEGMSNRWISKKTPLDFFTT